MELKYGAFAHRWYEELKNGKICGVKCRECGNVEFPPYYACSKCGGHEMEWIEISGKGELFDVSSMAGTSVPLPGTGNDGKKQRDPVFNSVPGAIRTAEGNERNMRVYGINEFNKEEVFALLPVPVEAFIVTKYDPEADAEYQTVGWRYSGPGAMTDDEYAEKKGLN